MKKTIILVTTLIAFTGIYTGYWFYQKQEVEKHIVSEFQAFETKHPNIKFKHEGLSVNGFPFNFYVNILNPHLTWIQTSGYTLKQAPEVYLKGEMTLSANLNGQVNKMSTNGDLHFIFDMENDKGTSETTHILLSGQTEEQIIQNNPTDNNLASILKSFSFGRIDFKNLKISAYKDEKPLTLAEIDKAHLQATSIENGQKQKISLTVHYAGITYNDNLIPILYNRSMPFFENYKTEKSSQSAELILEMPKFEELAALFENDFDPNQIPEFSIYANSKLDSEIYNSKGSLTFDFKKEGINDQYLVFKTDGDIFYSEKGKKIAKQIYVGAIADGILHSPSKPEEDPAADKIQDLFKEVVALPGFADLLGELPDFIKYDLDMNMKYSKEPLFKDTKIQVRNFSLEAPKSGIKLNLANKTADFSEIDFKAVLNLHNLKSIVHTHVSFYNRLADLLNPVLAKEPDLEIKQLPKVSTSAENDLIEILKDFSDKTDSDMDITLSFSNDETEGFKIGSKSAMEMFMVLFGFYNQHLVSEQ